MPCHIGFSASKGMKSSWGSLLEGFSRLLSADDSTPRPATASAPPPPVADDDDVVTVGGEIEEGGGADEEERIVEAAEEEADDEDEDDTEEDEDGAWVVLMGRPRLATWWSSLSGDSTQVLMSGASRPPRTICRGWYMRRGVESSGRMGLVEKTTLSTGTPSVRLLCTALNTTATTSGRLKLRCHERFRRGEQASRKTMAMSAACSSTTTAPVNTSPPVVTLPNGPPSAPPPLPLPLPMPTPASSWSSVPRRRTGGALAQWPPQKVLQKVV